MEPPRQVQLKIGKRLWRLLIADEAAPTDEATSLAESVAKDAVDLLLVRTSDDRLREFWEQSIAKREEDWQTRFVADSLNEELRNTIGDACLVIGPRRLVDRFCEAVKPGELSRVKGTPPFLNADPERIAQRLPEPGDIPPFPEEGHYDPFGLDRILQATAWSEVAQFAGRLIAESHRHAMAMTLPSPPAGRADPDLRPWRTVVQLKDEPAEFESPDEFISAPIQLRKDLDQGFDLFQRCLLTSAALQDKAEDVRRWKEVAAALERFGYLLISNGLDVDSFPLLMPFFEIGAWAEHAHSKSVLHGDMHPGNFGLRGEPSSYEPGQRALTFDVGDSRILDRPLTAKERAQDLAILRTQCTFVQWEAAKWGYALKAPEIAEEVFKFF